MPDEEPRWPTPSAPERAIAMLVLIGIGLAFAALLGMALLGKRPDLLIVFWCGFAVLAGATFAGLFVQRAIPALRGPQRTVAAGFLLLGLAVLLEAGDPPGPLRVSAQVLLLAGIGWGLWELGGQRR